MRRLAERLVARLLSGSVVVRLAVSTSVLIVVTCAALSVVLVRRHLADIRQSLVDRGHVISQFLAREGELGVLSGNIDELRRLAAMAVLQRDVAYCRFLDRDGSQLIAVPEHPPLAWYEGGNDDDGVATLLRFDAPITIAAAAPLPEEVGFDLEAPREGTAPSARKQIGVVVVGLTLDSVRAERVRATLTALAFTGGIVLLALLSALVLILGPVQALASTAELAAERTRVAELQTRFVAQASHEFRTPLSVILASAEVLKRYAARMSGAQQQERLTKIEGSVRHMVDLLDDVLVVGRVDSGRMVCEPQPIDLAALCYEMLADVRTGATEAHRLELSGVTSGPDRVMLDPKLIRQVLRNLLTNAIKYSPAGGLVELAVERAAASVTFRVTDEGIGIPPEDQPRLYESFHRGANVGKIPGSGLGLAIAQRAVALHGGTIAATSELGCGTTFTVVLPVRQALADGGRPRAAG
jgi:signal transduction histidine kinase